MQHHGAPVAVASSSVCLKEKKAETHPAAVTGFGAKWNRKDGLGIGSLSWLYVKRQLRKLIDRGTFLKGVFGKHFNPQAVNCL